MENVRKRRMGRRAKGEEEIIAEFREFGDREGKGKIDGRAGVGRFHRK